MGALSLRAVAKSTKRDGLGVRPQATNESHSPRRIRSSLLVAARSARRRARPGHGSRGGRLGESVTRLRGKALARSQPSRTGGVDSGHPRRLPDDTTAGTSDPGSGNPRPRWFRHAVRSLCPFHGARRLLCPHDGLRTPSGLGRGKAQKTQYLGVARRAIQCRVVQRDRLFDLPALVQATSEGEFRLHHLHGRAAHQSRQSAR